MLSIRVYYVDDALNPLDGLMPIERLVTKQSMGGSRPFFLN